MDESLFLGLNTAKLEEVSFDVRTVIVDSCAFLGQDGRNLCEGRCYFLITEHGHDRPVIARAELTLNGA